MKKYLKISALSIYTFVLFGLVNIVSAATTSEAEAIFNWAENNFQELFPNKQSTQAIDPWVFRFYPATEIYVGAKGNEVFVLGGPWGVENPTFIDTVSNLTAQVAASESPVNQGASSRISTLRYDFDNNGIFEGTAQLFYDMDGRISEVIYVYSDDGVSDTDFISFSIGFEDKDATESYTYDSNGRLILLEFTNSETGRTESSFIWNDSDLVTQSLLDIYDTSGDLTAKITFSLSYTDNRVTSWVTALDSILFPELSTQQQSGYEIMYTPDNLPSVVTEMDNSERDDLSWNSQGQVVSAISTDPGDSNYKSSNFFTYSDDGQILTETTITESILGNENYKWLHVYDANNRLIETQIDLNSDGTIEAVISSVWEEGACQPILMWAQGGQSNNLTAASKPYVSGTGYGLIDFCSTSGHPYVP